MQTEYVSKEQLLADIWQYQFTKPANFSFVAGDFCELELGDENHGGARWLTIASSPLADNLEFITKNNTKSSSFKRYLDELQPGQKAWLSPALGMFHLPRNLDEKILFIALGLGVTPYKSMLDWVADKNLSYNNTRLLYWAKPGQHLPLVNSAATKKVTTNEYDISLKSIDNLCDDWQQRTIYLSGPEPICLKLYQQLREANIPIKQIKLDYFEGYYDI